MVDNGDAWEFAPIPPASSSPAPASPTPAPTSPTLAPTSPTPAPISSSPASPSPLASPMPHLPPPPSRRRPQQIRTEEIIALINYGKYLPILAWLRAMARFLVFTIFETNL